MWVIDRQGKGIFSNPFPNCTATVNSARDRASSAPQAATSHGISTETTGQTGVSMTTALYTSLDLFSMSEHMASTNNTDINASPFPNVDEQLRCRYTSKPCGNVRTSKRGGGLHRFCAFHRARANENQWRVDHRRRLRKQETGNPTAAPRAQSPRTPRPQADLPVLMPNDCAVGRDRDEESLDMSPEELRILQALLFSDAEADAAAETPL